MAKQKRLAGFHITVHVSEERGSLAADNRVRVTAWETFVFAAIFIFFNDIWFVSKTDSKL